jgi:predicted enzyme related to lactoylglutathione lyase
VDQILIFFVMAISRGARVRPALQCPGGKFSLMPPTPANGKICYIEMPANDVGSSADFYKKVFGWNIRKRSDGATSFDDTTGEVSGAFVLGRAPQSPGFVMYIMVDSVAAAVDAVVAHGGKIVQPIGVDAPEITARFSDPAGNVIGLYQEPEQTP